MAEMALPGYGYHAWCRGLEMDRIDELISRLDSSDYRVRCDAIEALRGFEDPRVAPALIRCLGNIDYQSDNDSRSDRKAAIALSDRGEAAFAPLLAALREESNDPNAGSRRYWVAQALGLTGERRAIEPLIEALERDSDRDALEGILEALVLLDKRIGLGDRKPIALEALIDARKRIKSRLNYTRAFMKRTIKAWRKDCRAK